MESSPTRRLWIAPALAPQHGWGTRPRRAAGQLAPEERLSANPELRPRGDLSHASPDSGGAPVSRVVRMILRSLESPGREICELPSLRGNFAPSSSESARVEPCELSRAPYVNWAQAASRPRGATFRSGSTVVWAKPRAEGSCSKPRAASARTRAHRTRWQSRLSTCLRGFAPGSAPRAGTVSTSL